MAVDVEQIGVPFVLIPVIIWLVAQLPPVIPPAAFHVAFPAASEVRTLPAAAPVGTARLLVATVFPTRLLVTTAVLTTLLVATALLIKFQAEMSPVFVCAVELTLIGAATLLRGGVAVGVVQAET